MVHVSLVAITATTMLVTYPFCSSHCLSISVTSRYEILVPDIQMSHFDLNRKIRPQYAEQGDRVFVAKGLCHIKKMSSISEYSMKMMVMLNQVSYSSKYHRLRFKAPVHGFVIIIIFQDIWSELWSKSALTISGYGACWPLVKHTHFHFPVPCRNLHRTVGLGVSMICLNIHFNTHRFTEDWELSWCQLYHHWWRWIMTTSGPICDNKVVIMMTGCVQWFRHYLFDMLREFTHNFNL